MFNQRFEVEMNQTQIVRDIAIFFVYTIWMGGWQVVNSNNNATSWPDLASQILSCRLKYKDWAEYGN